MKSTQELIMQLFKNKNPYQKNINNKNTNLLLNHKNNFFYQNLTNRAKYKTSKNSPESNLVQNNMSGQKKFLDKTNNSKIQINNITKIIFTGAKRDEIIKKKIIHMKERKISQKNNNNNNNSNISMNITNNIYQNYINNLYIKNKGIFINKIHKPNENQNISKKNNSINTKKANTVRGGGRGGGEMNKRANSNYDIKKKNKYANNINNEESIKKSSSKYFNLINQYIASVSAVSKQPHRPNNQKNRYMTINAKKVKDLYKQNSISNSQIYKKLGITMENTNNENINNINLNKIKNSINSINNIYNNINQNNNNIKNNFIFSSTSNSLNKKQKKTSKKISNFRFELRRINRTSYQSKPPNRIHSLEKSIQNSINHSSINCKINSIAFVKNFNSPSITMYNKQNGEVLKKYLMNVNSMNNINNKNINKYLFNGVNNIVDLKKKSIEKSINHLYKQKQKEKEFNYLISIKEVKDNKDNNNVNSINKNSKSNININFSKEIKENKKKEKDNLNQEIFNNGSKTGRVYEKKMEENIINDINLSHQNQKKEKKIEKKNEKKIGEGGCRGG